MHGSLILLSDLKETFLSGNTFKSTCSVHCLRGERGVLIYGEELYQDVLGRYFATEKFWVLPFPYFSFSETSTLAALTENEQTPKQNEFSYSCITTLSVGHAFCRNKNVLKSCQNVTNCCQ